MRSRLQPSSISLRKQGFTLLELLTAMGIISVLTLLGFSAWKGVMGQATKAHCSSNLRQLCAAVMLYTSDHGGSFPPYVENGKDGSKNWYFGHESGGGAEGERELDREAGPLYPYIQTVGQIEVCKGFNYGSALWKPKFKGASYGYGYNWILGGRFGGMPMNIAQLKSGSRVLLFGDCGQANTFQPPATPSKPLLEEFYLINEKERTVHFRHSGRANIVFVDGHVESFKPFPGTEDKRIKGEVIGRITKKGSLEYLQ